MDKGFQVLKIVLLGSLSILIPFLFIYQSSNKNELAAENCNLKSENVNLIRELNRKDSISKIIDSLKVQSARHADTNGQPDYSEGKVFSASTLQAKFDTTIITNNVSRTSTVTEIYELTEDQSKAFYNWIKESKLKRLSK